MVVICALVALIFLISTVTLAIILGLKYKGDKQVSRSVGERLDEPGAKQIEWPKASGSLYGQFKKAAIATDHGLCSEIGRNILFIGGNVVDASIASLLCIGVVNPQSSGLGGGFLMTIYNRTTGRCLTVNARETAPAAASRTMFVHNTAEATTGYKAIAVPSELHGMWKVYQNYGSGKIAWRRLVEPSINLALNGFPVSSNLAQTLAEKESSIYAEKSLRDVFVDPQTQRIYKEGDLLRRGTLARTLQMLANASDPSYLFYQGAMAHTIAAEMAANGGVITLNDLVTHETVVVESPLETDVLPGRLTMCGPPPPSSFAVTQSIVAVFKEFYGNNKHIDLDDPLVYHRLIEAEKFAYAQRSRLGDIAFVSEARSLVQNLTTSSYAKWIKSLIDDKAHPLNYYSVAPRYPVPDHGTSHVSAIDSYGNALAVTDTINLKLGSLRVSPQLGIVWNNEMDDFSTPGLNNAFNIAPSEANFIQPGKRPMSSMSPTVIYNRDTGKVKMVVGASGGIFIISATAQTVIRTFFFNETVKEAVDAPRLHNQYLPHVTQYEESFPRAIIEELRTKRGQPMESVDKQESVVQVLEVMDDGFIHGNSDFRRKTATYPAGF